MGVRLTALTLKDPTIVAVTKDLRRMTANASVGVQPLNIIHN